MRKRRVEREGGKWREGEGGEGETEKYVFYVSFVKKCVYTIKIPDITYLFAHFLNLFFLNIHIIFFQPGTGVMLAILVN